MLGLVVVPPNEEERLRALRGVGILDTEADERFDRITRMVAELLDVPIALVSLVDEDRQWFKSRVGLDATQTSRDVAFCAHAILDDDPLIVHNALDDARFRDNPLVQGAPNIRFYAGAPLILHGEVRLGTLCAIDTKSRVLSDQQQSILQELSRVITDEIVLHLRNQELRAANQSLESFAHITAHDLRAPLKSMVNLCDIAAESPGEERGELIALVRAEATKAETLVGKYHALSRLRAATPERQPVGLAQLSCAARDATGHPSIVVEGDATVEGDEVLLEQMLVNLFENARKHGAPGDVEVRIGAEQGRALICVRNPAVAAVEDAASLFAAFRRASENRTGAGLGLAIVARIVELHDGQVTASSDADHFEIQVQLPATQPELTR